MFYQEDIIEEVRQRNDIVDVISQYVGLKKKGSNYMGLCPFHNEKSPSFSVSHSKQMYHCFGCGVGGNIYTFIMEYENYSFSEAVKYLADKAGVKLPEGEISPEEKKKASVKSQLLEMYKQAATYYYMQLYNTPKGKTAYEYLSNRQLSDETIKRFGLGYSDVNGGLYSFLKSKGYDDGLLKESGLFTFDEKRGVYDKFWNRVMYPIMDINNKVIGFGGRVMGDGKPKYLNSPETMLFDKSRNLFGMNIARTSRRPNLIICEGYMDVIALHQAGFNNAVASLGTALTGLQANLMKRYTDNILLTYDSDEAGVKAALRAIPILKGVGLSIKVINMRPYKDPDEFIKALGTEEFQNRIDNAVNSFYYETDVIAGRYDMSDPEEKTKFHNELAKKMLDFPEELERNNYAEAIASKYNIDFDKFRKLINHHGAQAVVNRDNEELYQREEKKSDKKTADSAVKASQRMLLTWFAEENRLFSILKDIIEATDFKEPLYAKAAQIMFSQYEKEGSVVPAKIINSFDSKEEQNAAAQVFSTNITAQEEDGQVVRDFKELSGAEKETYLNQLVKTVKLDSIEYDLRNSVDFEVLRKCSAMKAKLQTLVVRI